MPMELLKGTLQQNNMDPFKNKKEEKDLPTSIMYSWGVCVEGGRRHKSWGVRGQGALEAL